MLKILEYTVKVYRWLIMFNYVAAIEFSERLSYFGIATSLVIYLTKVMNQDLKTAVRSVNYWSGVTTLTPLLGGFLADAYLGRYITVLISCIVYLMVINDKPHLIFNFTFSTTIIGLIV